MDMLLGKVTQQAMNYAIRSGVALTASYAIRQSAKLIAHAPQSKTRDDLFQLQLKLQHKIQIISPAIDMIELIAARGNTSLDSALNLTKELRIEIQSISQRLAQAASNAENTSRLIRVSTQTKNENEVEMIGLRDDIRILLGRIDDAVPLISLAITTSGVTLSASLPQTVSPSRLLQASTLLVTGDGQYQMHPHTTVQVGPTFTLTIYMLFAGHDRPQNEEDIRETTWKEVIHKARVKLRRVPLDVVIQTGSGSDAIPSADIKSPSSEPTETDLPAEHRHDEFAYQLMIVEDFDDDRMHDFEEDQPQPGPFDDVELAGIREMIPIHEVSKIFYADTSKVLNISTDAETNHPVLLLKRDINAVPPRRMVEREVADEKESAKQDYVEDHSDRNKDPWRLPPSLDPEWIAFEVYTEAEPDSEPTSPDDSTRLAPTESLDESISKLNITSPSPANTTTSPAKLSHPKPTQTQPPPPWATKIPTSLSLLELLLRLTSLQQFQQTSHLSITDELLNFFLEESASTGAGGDENYRQATRAQARRQVGWDPYDESPVKRRGEEYQYQGGGGGYGSPREYQNQYQGGIGYGSPMMTSGGSQQAEQGATLLNGSPGGGSWAPNSARQQQQQQSPSAPEGGGDKSGWQTRSITKLSDSPSPSPSRGPMAGKGRGEWLRRDDGRERRKGSPLRPSTGRSDEGLGTSPISELQQ